MKLHFTSGYHPEADGQTERANQTLEQYIRIFTSYQQDNWSSILPLAEFAYNNAPNASTGITPFFANKGYHPNITYHPERDLASLQARDFVANLDEVHDFLRQEIRSAQTRYKEQADKLRKPQPEFTVGQKVYVSSEHIKTTRPAKKLSEQYLGPFEISAQVGTRSFMLKMPTTLRGIHPVFHVSQLKPFNPSSIPNRTQPPPPPVEFDGEPVYEVAAILDSKVDKRFRTAPLRYYIQWEGYQGTDLEFDWVGWNDVVNAQEALDAFHSQNPSKPGPWPLS